MKIRRQLSSEVTGVVSSLLPSVPGHCWWVTPESCEGLTVWTLAKELQASHVRATRSEIACILLPVGSVPNPEGDTITCKAYAEWDSAWAPYLTIEFAMDAPAKTDWGIEFEPLGAEMLPYLATER